MNLLIRSNASRSPSPASRTTRSKSSGSNPNGPLLPIPLLLVLFATGVPSLRGDPHSQLSSSVRSGAEVRHEPFLVTGQECVLCGPNGVGRRRWVFSGGPACLMLVGVSVGRNCRAVVVWCSADGQAWPVVCPQSSAVGCGVLPAVA